MTPAQALGEMLKLSSVTSRGWKFDLWLKAIYSFKYFHKKSRRNEDHKLSVPAKNLEEGQDIQSKENINQQRLLQM